MFIQILIDNSGSWIIPYAITLQKKIIDRGHKCNLVYKHKEIQNGEIAVLLSCERIFNKLGLNRYNLVVHESDLPSGKGFSPMTWQVLEGKKQIPICLIEAAEKVDSGNIYYKEYIKLEGHEIIDEIRKKQGEKTIELILRFIDNYPRVAGIPQTGASSFYARRKPEHSKLNVNKSLKDQFNLLRVCDNQRYPAFFEMQGHSYILKIEKMVI